ncbi:hypothetical protein [Anaeromyxobacter oryzae]|uniref:hypothetical protein n=1 Tax=Anaeromyxobacter oryzae TaxID=2918170 RepID=UPI0020C15476|nr:hypothetical protein [Anaeromyxobacter oryzae]
MHLTVAKRFEAKVAEARDALSYSHPGASTEEILEVALDLLLDRAKKRKGLVEKPRREKRPSRPDHIPAEVKRAVWVRDGGCCRWALENGGVCGSRHRLAAERLRLDVVVLPTCSPHGKSSAMHGWTGTRRPARPPRRRGAATPARRVRAPKFPPRP